LFTDQPFLVGAGSSATSDEPVGIFLIIQDSSEKHVHYDADFKKHATIEYVEKDLTGKTIKIGDFVACDTA